MVLLWSCWIRTWTLSNSRERRLLLYIIRFACASGVLWDWEDTPILSSNILFTRTEGERGYHRLYHTCTKRRSNEKVCCEYSVVVHIFALLMFLRLCSGILGGSFRFNLGPWLLDSILKSHGTPLGATDGTY